MLDIKFERFNAAKSPLQSYQLGKLVAANASWLADSDYAGALSRYGSGQLRAIKNIVRIGRSSSHHAYVITTPNHRPSHRLAIGIASVTPGVAIEHPQAGRLAGTDVDYWLDTNYDTAPEVHRVAGAMLLQAAAEHGDLPLIAAMRPEADHQPLGLAPLMHEVGQPAVLRAAESGALREDELIKQGNTLQLYSTSS